jgi:hypothetical protein
VDKLWDLDQYCIPVIFPGNAETTGQVYTHVPSAPKYHWKEFIPHWLDAEDSHPSITNDPSNRCSSEKTIEKQPQTSMANMMAASLAVAQLFELTTTNIYDVVNSGEIDFKTLYSTFSGAHVHSHKAINLTKLKPQ